MKTAAKFNKEYKLNKVLWGSQKLSMMQLRLRDLNL